MVETWIDYGAGFVRYIDEDGGRGDGVGGERALSAGGRLVRTIVLVDGRVGNQRTVPFPTTGTYKLRVVFRGRSEADGVPGAVLGESPEMTYQVVAPDASGQGLVQQIRNAPWKLRATGGQADADYGALWSAFPGSPYLHWGRRSIALESEDAWGQFDEERLTLAAENFERGGAFDRALPVWREIVERFPGSEGAEKAKSRIDTTPPSPELAATPATLWPPNNKLVPVTVAVEVSDDTDPKPTVKLLSVTCDDACNAAQDIVGAALNTDDRSFQLRATRRGVGSGRTYTITFEARDAVGNVATAKTTVTVPHDQR